jgi:thiol:disulfide interchange protein
MVRALVLVFAGLAAQPSLAADTSQVQWYSDVNEAWRASQQQSRPLLVFVTRTDCLPCARMKTKTYTDPKVAGAINSGFVALTINSAQPCPLLNDLAVNAVPATFVISPNAVILQRFDGYLSPEDLSARLSQVAPAARPGPAAVAQGRTF